MLIGELYLPFEQLVHHYGDNNEYHMPFNFSLIESDWDADTIGRLIVEYEKHLPIGAWPNWVLGNHDKSRLATRVGPLEVKNSILLLLTLRGTPTIYNGEELGLEDVEIPAHQVQDPQARLSGDLAFGRDASRTPMLWDSSANAGFSETNGELWLPIHEKFSELCVRRQQETEKSYLNFTRRLLEVRKNNPALVRGTVEFLYAEDDTLVYIRTLHHEKFLIVINLGSQNKKISFKNSEKITDKIFEDLDASVEVGVDYVIVPGDHGAILALER